MQRDPLRLAIHVLNTTTATEILANSLIPVPCHWWTFASRNIYDRDIDNKPVVTAQHTVLFALVSVYLIQSQEIKAIAGRNQVWDLLFLLGINRVCM